MILLSKCFWATCLQHLEQTAKLRQRNPVQMANQGTIFIDSEVALVCYCTEFLCVQSLHVKLTQ